MIEDQEYRKHWVRGSEEDFFFMRPMTNNKMASDEDSEDP